MAINTLSGGVTLNSISGGLKSSQLPDGSVLQVVVGTDSTDRTTSSTSFVDANISVTITPSSAASSILLFWNTLVLTPAGNTIRLAITDSSNNTLTGGELMSTSSAGGALAYSSTSIATDSPGTTSAVTYKGRFLVTGATGSLVNSSNTGMLVAMEVAA